MGEITRLTYTLQELSDCEHLVLNYCLARLEPMRFAQPFLVVWQQHCKRVGAQVARQQRNLGFERLMEKGILTDAKRDGHMDWDLVPEKSRLHLDMLVDGHSLVSGTAGGGLIVGEGE